MAPPYSKHLPPHPESRGITEDRQRMHDSIMADRPRQSSQHQ